MQSSRPELALSEVASHFSTIPDPRVVGRTTHPMLTIVTIAFVAIVGGVKGWDAMRDFAVDHQEWFSSVLAMPCGVPSADTFRRLFAVLRPEVFAKAAQAWVKTALHSLAGQVVAMDGKTLRGAKKRVPPWAQAPLHRVHVWACEQRLLLAQTAVDGAPNEPEALLQLLPGLDVTDAILTGDANQLSFKMTQGIRDAHAHYLLALKGNREAMHDAVEARMLQLEASQFADVAVQTHTEASEGHGRDEVRRGWSIAASEVPELTEKLVEVNSVTMLIRTRIAEGKVSAERVYYVSSLPPEVQPIMKAVRTHWGVENGLHWTLDAQMREDDCTIHEGHAPENLATLRGLALMLLAREQTFKAGAARKQAKVSRNTEYRERVLLGIFTED